MERWVLTPSFSKDGKMGFDSIFFKRWKDGFSSLFNQRKILLLTNEF
jgi:hypothetical protein